MSEGYWTSRITNINQYLLSESNLYMGKTPFFEDPAWPKIRHFCAYRERCHSEVRDKLYSLGLRKNNVETLIARLIEEDILNEQRFADAFAGGHFRQKNWGKEKIRYALRLKKISEPVIKKALSGISGPDYATSLQKLAAARWAALKGEHYLTRQAKTSAYLLQKGYERDAVQKMVAALRAGKENISK